MLLGEGLGEALGEQDAQGRVRWAYLEGAFVGKCVNACRSSARLAEEQQLFKEENAAQGLVAPSTHCELILSHQLPLFLEVNLPIWGPVGAQPRLPPPFTPITTAHHSLR